MLYSSIAVVDSIGSVTALLQVISFLLVEVSRLQLFFRSVCPAVRLKTFGFIKSLLEGEIRLMQSGCYSQKGLS